MGDELCDTVGRAGSCLSRRGLRVRSDWQRVRTAMKSTANALRRAVCTAAPRVASIHTAWGITLNISIDLHTPGQPTSSQHVEVHLTYLTLPHEPPCRAPTTSSSFAPPSHTRNPLWSALSTPLEVHLAEPCNPLQQTLLHDQPPPDGVPLAPAAPPYRHNTPHPGRLQRTSNAAAELRSNTAGSTAVLLDPPPPCLTRHTLHHAPPPVLYPGGLPLHKDPTENFDFEIFSLNVLALNATMSASPSRQADPVDEAPKTCALALPPHAARAAPPAWMCRALLLNVAVPHSLVAVRRQHITRPRPHCIAARGGSPRVAQ
jgi:hypothetical protein